MKILHAGIGAVAAATGALMLLAWPFAGHGVPRGSEPSCAADASTSTAAGAPPGMVWIRGGRFTMGASDAYPEEADPIAASVDGFWIDRYDVTNAQFAAFVQATGYSTLAERKPGSVVFVQPTDRQPGVWRFVSGANWRHPQGPGSDLEGRANHPVVQVAYEDAFAYARWAGRELPTEAQWEFAARGGLERQRYVWGADAAPNGKPMANTWQGEFPFRNTGNDGYPGTSPVGCFPANGYGLYDMAGNVWQWTSTWYRPRHDSAVVGNDPADPSQAQGFDPRQPGVPTLVLKGGSHLCAPSYCLRYRPSARQAQEPGLATSHIGFRTVSSKHTGPS